MRTLLSCSLLLLVSLALHACNFRLVESPVAEFNRYLKDHYPEMEKGEAAIEEKLNEIALNGSLDVRLVEANGSLRTLVGKHLAMIRPIKLSARSSLRAVHELKIKAFEHYLKALDCVKTVVDSPETKDEQLVLFKQYWDDGANYDWNYAKALKPLAKTIKVELPTEGYFAERGENPPKFSNWLTR